MKGVGISHGAVSVMNAIPCGVGSTIGINLRTKATFGDSDKKKIILVGRPRTGTMLAETCVKRTMERIGQEVNDNYLLKIRTDIPPSMGLKSSSSVCNAVISAVLNAYGEKMDIIDIIKLGVECAKECKVTITGAFDDACGCGLGGLVVTNNSKNELILRKEIPVYDVVICVPNRSIPKSKVPVERYRELSDKYSEMVPGIENDYLNVLTENGRCVENIIGQSSGLSEKALEAGALAAGITGTGPATAVIVERGEAKKMAETLGCKTILSRTRC
jgi:shikimate kinase